MNEESDKRQYPKILMTVVERIKNFPLLTVLKSQNKSKILLPLGVLLILSISTFAVGLPSKAAVDPKSNLVIESPSDLPEPGMPVRFAIQIKGTRQTNDKLKLIAIIDGKRIDVEAPEGTLNENDVPTYEINLPAPKEELRFSWRRESGDGKIERTESRSLERQCRPEVAPAPALSAKLQGKEGLKVLSSQVRRLDNDLMRYNEALRLLEELDGLLAEGS